MCKSLKIFKKILLNNYKMEDTEENILKNIKNINEHIKLTKTNLNEELSYKSPINHLITEYKNHILLLEEKLRIEQNKLNQFYKKN
jgi:hypothetical protein